MNMKSELINMTGMWDKEKPNMDRAPAQCLASHGFDSCQGLRLFFVPNSCHVHEFTFHSYILLLNVCFVALKCFQHKIYLIMHLAVVVNKNRNMYFQMTEVFSSCCHNQDFCYLFYQCHCTRKAMIEMI